MMIPIRENVFPTVTNLLFPAIDKNQAKKVLKSIQTEVLRSKRYKSSSDKDFSHFYGFDIFSLPGLTVPRSCYANSYFISDKMSKDH